MQKQLAIKFLIILILGVSLLIPINMMRGKVYERQQYQLEAQAAIAESWTTEQTFVTPILVIPYQLKRVPSVQYLGNKHQQTIKQPPETHHLVILPESISTHVSIDNNNLKKGIYKIPVYSSSLTWKGTFNSQSLDEAKRKIQGHERFHAFEAPFMSLSISDLRGIAQAPELSINDTKLSLKPGNEIPLLGDGLHAKLNPKDLEQELEVHLNLTLNGMESFALVPLANHSNTHIDSNWPHPEFIGVTLPKDRKISATGFSASWSASLFSNNANAIMKKCIDNHTCGDILNYARGVRFIDPVNVYLQTERSLKYAILFIGLSFISFFVFEHSIRVQIHPIQYALVGFAIATFYLLLVSMSEHIPLGWAYLIGTISCTGLLLFYVRHMFQSRTYAVIYCVALTALFGLLYVILQAEDYALLMGSVLVFAMLSLLMIVTRKLDWYQLSELGMDARSN